MSKQIAVSQNRAFSKTTGAPEAGALAYMYRTGTTTKITLYADSALTVPLSNPVVADGNGFFPEVWADNTYEVRRLMTTAAGVTIEDLDPCPRWTTATDAASQIAFTPITGNSADDVQEAIANLQAEVLNVGARFCTFSGTATNTFNLTSDAGEPFTTIPVGLTVMFVVDLSAYSQTGAFTLNLDGIGAVNARNMQGTIVSGGYLRDGKLTRAIYDGTVFRVGREVEYVSNANGTAVKREDGTMTCRHSLAGSSGGPQTWTYPEAFLLVPSVSAVAQSASFRNAQLDLAPGTSSATFSVWDSSPARTTSTAYLTAEGYWT